MVYVDETVNSKTPLGSIAPIQAPLMINLMMSWPVPLAIKHVFFYHHGHRSVTKAMTVSDNCHFKCGR